mmetsp:Transcript_9216/g.22148  ORF Transcript_9216/g.22148 Transcript_9216/m.22148 type:complete len:287 (-) Transcript_9216:1228-2088(-)
MKSEYFSPSLTYLLVFRMNDSSSFRVASLSSTSRASTAMAVSTSCNVVISCGGIPGTPTRVMVKLVIFFLFFCLVTFTHSYFGSFFSSGFSSVFSSALASLFSGASAPASASVSGFFSSAGVSAWGFSASLVSPSAGFSSSLISRFSEVVSSYVSSSNNMASETEKVPCRESDTFTWTSFGSSCFGSSMRYVPKSFLTPYGNDSGSLYSTTMSKGSCRLSLITLAFPMTDPLGKQSIIFSWPSAASPAVASSSTPSVEIVAESAVCTYPTWIPWAMRSSTTKSRTL